LFFFLFALLSDAVIDFSSFQGFISMHDALHCRAAFSLLFFYLQISRQQIIQDISHIPIRQTMHRK
jgi:hypothetical protein